MKTIVNKTIIAGTDKLFDQSVKKDPKKEDKEESSEASVHNKSNESVASLPSSGRGHAAFVSGFNRKK